MFRTQLLKPTLYLPLVGVLSFAILHAVTRSVSSEFTRYRRPKVVASDGFVDECCGGSSNSSSNEEETLVFHEETAPNLRMRSCRSASVKMPGVVKRSSRVNAKLGIPMAAPVEMNKCTSRVK